MSQRYKDTLNLPRTDFPIHADLPAREPLLLAYWEDSDLYGQIQQARRSAPVYGLHDGPTFANGDVHMGLAFNKVLKDFVVKSKTMAGFRVPYRPGWHCHGLPVEYGVVQDPRGHDPMDVRRRAQESARGWVDAQRRQFKRLGILGEWESPSLTLDPEHVAETLRVFARLVDRGLVYRRRQPVPWSTGTQTALDEAEVEYREADLSAIHVKFPLTSGPLAGKASLVVWVAAPWTLPANQAVAVNAGFGYRAQVFRHPRTGREETLLFANALAEGFCKATGYTRDESGVGALGTFLGSEMEGWKYRHPLLDRECPVILGDAVPLDTGTGCIPLAPGHRDEDFALGTRYGLPVFSPVDDDGRYTEAVGVPALVGRYVFDAETEIIALLGGAGALAGKSIVRRAAPYCRQSGTPVVPRASEEFFIRLDGLRPTALRAVDGVKWTPRRARSRLYDALEARPDWCISRRRPWGVPLPVFYDRDGQPVLRADWINALAILFKQYGAEIWFDPTDKVIAQSLDLPPGTTRRPDTLDAWIDSGASFQAVTHKLPGADRPADLCLESIDAHRGWFQSSLLLSIATRGQAPFLGCLTHGFVVDADTRRRLSKVRAEPATSPVPAGRFVDRHGADVIRLWISSAPPADEIPFGEPVLRRLAEAYQRLRNTLRILLGNLVDFDPARDAVTPDRFTFVDRWINHRLQEVVATCREAYAAFEFHRVYHALSQFCAVDLSSLYVDITKDRMYCDRPDSSRRRATQTVMHAAFEAVCRLLAPLCPFTAEEAWNFAGQADSVHVQLFPESDATATDPALPARAEELLAYRAAVARAVAQARQEKLIGHPLDAEVTLHVADDARRDELAALSDELTEFFTLSSLTLAGAETDDGSLATLRPSRHARCARCRRHRSDVGQLTVHPDLCGRCVDAVTSR